MPDEKRSTDRPTVVIFGGGITGLTAAHELGERGFSVVVYEAEEDLTAPPGTPAVGGMARTQWRWLPQTPSDRLSGGVFQHTYPVIRTPWRIDFPPDEHSVLADPEASQKLDEVTEFLDAHEEIKTLYIDAFSFDEGDDVARLRALAVQQALLSRGVDAKRLQVQPLGNVLTDDRFLEAKDRRYVAFSIDATRLPGEHGYRFFPSFYHHVFDTMKRTPIMVPVRRSDVEVARDLNRVARERQVNVHVETLTEQTNGTHYEETGFTAYDHLRSLPEHAIARNGRHQRPIVLSRQRVDSMEDLRKLIMTFLQDLNFRSTDIAIFNGKLLQFLTSCSERREAQYSCISWMKFIDSPHYSADFRCAMERWPHSLVALSASECDAHTHGVITVQLLLDQLRKGPTDNTLVGPTSTAWLDPWKTYLERRHDVKFVHKSLDGFRLTADKLRPGFQFRLPKRAESAQLFGYCVVALPIEEVASVFPQDVLDAIAKEVERNAQTRGDSRNDVQLAVEMSKSARGEAPDLWNTQKPVGPLRNFAGIQYYFEEDVNWVDGHTYYIDSPWGLSSVAQSVRWNEKMSRRDLYRAIVSVEIGIFDELGTNGKTAWDSSPKEFAEEVWQQIKNGADASDFTLPNPAYYHIDDNLIFHEEGTGMKGIKENKSPFLVPLKEMWEKRPGEPEDYRVYLNSIVLAGTYMKTFTRLTTMEAANESARHAVNAILKHRFGSEGVPSGILAETKSMIDRELPDAELLKEIDKELFKQGLPHFMDILKWDDWPAIPWHVLPSLLRRLL